MNVERVLGSCRKSWRKAIREMPRDAEVIELLKKVSGEGRFPRGNCEAT